MASSGDFGFHDYLALTNLLFRYTNRIDANDNSDVPGLGHLGKATGSRTIYPDTGTPKTHHVTSNVRIRPDGPNRATGHSYFTIFQATDDLPLQCVVCGTYTDKYEKKEGVWGFVERRFDYRLIGDLTHHNVALKVPRAPLPSSVRTPDNPY